MDSIVAVAVLQGATGEISAHLAEVYGASVSTDTASPITDKVFKPMEE